MLSTKEIKEIPIVETLKRIGFHPHKLRGNEAWYLSPFREEDKPSFKVDINKNVFYDFGYGKGGNAIDLIMMLKSLSFIETLKFYNGNYSTETVQKIRKTRIQENQENTSYKIVYNSSKISPSLVNYIESRNLDFDLCNKYLNQIKYQTGLNKEYYGIAFKNDSDGYEFRNKYQKNSLGTKDVTTFNNNSDTYKMFEGFSDFLSFVTMNPNEVDDYNYIILNSCSFAYLDKQNDNKEDAINKFSRLFKNITFDNSLIGDTNPYYDIVKNSNLSDFEFHFYFDNDNTGNKVTEMLSDILPISVDKSDLYQNYNDLNEYLSSGDNLNTTQKNKTII